MFKSTGLFSHNSRVFHYLVPLLAILAGIFSQYSGLDTWLTGHYYDQNMHVWLYRDLWLTQEVIHHGGRNLVAIIFISVMLAFLLTLLFPRWKQWRRALGYLLAASTTGLIIVAELKGYTHIYTPWDLDIFGGTYPHIRLFDHVANDAPVGNAFPAGHASGGYMMLSVYFLLHQLGNRYQYHALSIAILVGLVFGIDQQIRGAHMLSHDLFTLAICWLSCMLWSFLLFNRGRPMKSVSGDSQYVLQNTR